MIENIDKENIPKHIAIIMDGNGRWAKQQGMNRIFGHNNAIKAVRESVETCARLGVQYLTLYAFSTENWNRPQAEVSALMTLLMKTIQAETPTLHKNNIQLLNIGDKNALSTSVRKQLDECQELTSQNTGMKLVLALSYSARWEILQAVKSIADKLHEGKIVSTDIDESLFASELCTAQMPDPELMIRTSGEHRISNFLLWQLAYTEFFFTDVLWPDFRKENIYQAIQSYQKRERRFGKTSEQLKNLK